MSDQENPYAAPVATPAAPGIAPPLPGSADFVTATSGQRFVNLVIDAMIKMALLFAFGFVMGMAGQAEFFTNIGTAGEFMMNLVLTVLYYTFLEGLTGRSIGKLVTGTKVVDANGNPPGFGRAFLRSLCRFIPFEPFSFLGSDARGWHDSITKTWVIKAR